MENRYHVAVALCFILANPLTAQVKIGDNPTTINSNSVLELESTNKGFVLPRVSISNIDSSNPLTGSLLTSTLVYNTNGSVTGGSGKGFYYWDGSQWNLLRTITGKAWTVKGNDSLKSSTNFLGTIDSFGLSLRTASKEAIHIDSLQRVSIDTNTALTNFDVNGGIRSSNLSGGGMVLANSNGTLTLASGGIKGSISFDYTTPNSTTVPGATLSLLGLGALAPGKLDLSITLASTLPNTTVLIDAWPTTDLPDNISIAFERLISTTQIKIRLLNAGTVSQSVSGIKFHITLGEF